MIQAGPLVELHISVTRAPWRLAPAWSVGAGALAVTGLPVLASDVLRLAAAIVVGDLAWGMLRQYTLLAPGGAPVDDPRAPLAPYGQPTAPLSRIVAILSGGPEPGEGRMRGSWQGAAAGLALSLGGGVLFGWPGVILSLAALGCIVAGWSIARRGEVPAACHAALDVLLPWSLGVAACGRLEAGAVPWEAALVGVAFTVLQWGYLRATHARPAGGPWPLVAGMGGVLAVLVGLGWPWAAAVVAVLFAPVAYGWLGRAAGGDGIPAAAPTAGAALWLALFVAAAALR